MTIIAQVRALLVRAGETFPELAAQVARLDEPPRIAIAGEPGQTTLRKALADQEFQNDPAEADAVICLIRIPHATDVPAMASGQGSGVAGLTRVNTIGVLTRADDVGAGRLDAMSSASQIARRYAADPRLRGVCQTVVTAADLLAANTLGVDDFEAFRRLVEMPRSDADAGLLSADRVQSIVGGLASRWGMFGVRLGVTLIRQGFHDSGRLGG